MNPLEFLDLASEWSVGTREGEWRSSISRAYYAVFHVARNLLAQVGFQVPSASVSHQYLFQRLNNCGEPIVQKAATLLNNLRRERNFADYDLDAPVDEQRAIDAVNDATDVNSTLTDLAANPGLLPQVTQAMRDYERQVLGVVTWRSP
ncbi:MAG: HEPN domain-containing protein [Gemmataceae bacterium]